jgi:murein L,D-transpeptidase YcbB/YkuD
MEKPDLLAKVILAEGNQMLASEVEGLWDNRTNSRIELERAIPVHSTYFTAVVDGSYKISTYPDLYGLDTNSRVQCSAMPRAFQCQP